MKDITKVFSPSDRRSKIIYRPEKLDMPYAYLYDISKAKQDLGYEVRYPYMRILQDIKHEMACQRFPQLISRGKKG